MRMTGFLLLIYVAACTESQEPTLGPCEPDSLAVTVTATPDAVFDWSPSCPMLWLWVQPLNDDVVWYLVSESLDNTISPPVSYGVVPIGARPSRPAPTLDTGSCYHVYVDRAVHKADGVYSSLAGITTFCPSQGMAPNQRLQLTNREGR